MKREKSREFEGWRRYFEAQARRDDPIPWSRDRRLTESERRAISRSIRTFQRGESSSGERFVAAAREWAARGGDPEDTGVVLVQRKHSLAIEAVCALVVTQDVLKGFCIRLEAIEAARRPDP